MQLSADTIAKLRLVLKNISFLQFLKMNELDALIGALEKRPFGHGEVIIKQGKVGDEFFILASGSVGVYREKMFTKKRIVTLAENAFFGEMALINNEPRAATVIGDGVGELYFLSRKSFEQILLKNPGIADIIRQISDKRKAQNRQLDQN
jgi:CRP-like cAMP-binding protein